MSENLVSHHFQFPDRQMVQMDHESNRVDSATADMQREVVGHVSHNPMPLHFAVSNDQSGPVGHISGSSGFPNVIVSNNQMRQMELNAEFLGFGDNVILTNMGLQTSSLPSKRKAEVEPTANNSVPQQQAVPNKRVAQGSPPHFSQSMQSAASNKKPFQMQSKLGSSNGQNLPALNKKLIRNESISSKTGTQRVQTPRSRTMQYEPTSKKLAESSEAVRSKMREQLAAALALASQNQDKSSNAEKNAESSAGKNAESTGRNLISSDSQHPGSDSSADKHKHQDSGEALPSGESCSTGKSDEGQGSSGEFSTSGGLGNPAGSCEVLHSSLPGEDVSFSDNFYVKDELLQGNGLSWALDDMGATEAKELQNNETAQVSYEGADRDTREHERASPENLALEIEEELFKLFGGVNKKYKEKGRSLLFNLKDRNNPELRERVMSGEIPPERLCSMTAEELASKELSEWRMAKAEELAQMVVLPDTDFDRRRLVKKTHKGEYQVEMDGDDGNSVEISGGASLISQTIPVSRETEANPSSELDTMKDKENIQNQEKSSENQEASGSLIIPSDGTDLMQGMMVDELKDVEFLPPIVSLDEFMESLNSEPPFENLRVNAAEQSTPASEKENSKSDDKLANTDSASEDLRDTVSNKPDETIVKHTVDLDVKPSESPMGQKISPPVNESKSEHTWEGTLQLNISSSITTFGVFKSGEKTSTAEWPSSLEIKGRVRLDAFEKFIKELPNSRTRAVMVLNLDLKDKSSDNEQANLQEAVDSYVSDERLGFAEPGPGVELYLCPPNEKMIDMLSSYLSKDRTDILNSTDNGLIGVVVWRKAHTGPLISPNSSSHHKHSSKRQHFTSRRQQEKDANVNMDVSKEPASYNRLAPNVEQPPDDDDSDIPPGFGPPAARTVRDDDDLPEFNFSGNVNPAIARSSSQNLPQGSRIPSFNSAQVSSRPVDQIRQLIHKYGQTGSSGSNNSTWLDNKGPSSVGLGIESWNDDDDDDIPEWRPQAPLQQHQTHPPSHSIRQPFANQHFVPTVANQQLNPAGMPLQSTANVVSGSAAAWQHPPGNPSNQPSGGQYYRMPLLQAGHRQDSPRRRGF